MTMTDLLNRLAAKVGMTKIEKAWSFEPNKFQLCFSKFGVGLIFVRGCTSNGQRKSIYFSKYAYDSNGMLMCILHDPHDLDANIVKTLERVSLAGNDIYVEIGNVKHIIWPKNTTTVEMVIALDLGEN